MFKFSSYYYYTIQKIGLFQKRIIKTGGSQQILKIYLLIFCELLDRFDRK